MPADHSLNDIPELMVSPEMRRILVVGMVALLVLGAAIVRYGLKSPSPEGFYFDIGDYPQLAAAEVQSDEVSLDGQFGWVRREMVLTTASDELEIEIMIGNDGIPAADLLDGKRGLTSQFESELPLGDEAFRSLGSVYFRRNHVVWGIQGRSKSFEAGERVDPRPNCDVIELAVRVDAEIVRQSAIERPPFRITSCLPEKETLVYGPIAVSKTMIGVELDDPIGGAVSLFGESMDYLFFDYGRHKKQELSVGCGGAAPGKRHFWVIAVNEALQIARGTGSVTVKESAEMKRMREHRVWREANPLELSRGEINAAIRVAKERNLTGDEVKKLLKDWMEAKNRGEILPSE